MFNCFKRETIYDKFYVTAKAEMGVEEVPGSGNNPRIIEYGKVTSQCGVKSARSARAKDYLEWGKPLDKPVRGCVCVFTRDGGGHVGFFHSEDEKYVYVLAGNQGDEVNISARSKAQLLGYRGVA